MNTKGAPHLNTFLVFVPAIAVPAGFTSDNLPAGITFLGRPYDEGQMLKLAYGYEQATHHRRAPKTAPPLLLPSPNAWDEAEHAVLVRTFDDENVMRGLGRLAGYPDAYLWVVRSVEPGVFQHLKEASASLAAYREAERSRARIQAAWSRAPSCSRPSGAPRTWATAMRWRP